MQELEHAADDLRAQRYDLPHVRDGKPKGDRLGAVVEAHETMRRGLELERGELEAAISNGKRLLAETVSATNDPTVKKGAYFVMARARGMSANRAAAAVGLPRSTAYEYQKRLAQALVDFAPERFKERTPYGWQRFVRSVTS